MRHMRVHLVSFNSIYYVHTFYEDPSYIVLPEALQQTSSKVLIYLLLQKIFPYQSLICFYTLRSHHFIQKEITLYLRLYYSFRFIKISSNNTIAFSILLYIKKDKYLYLVMRMLVNNMLLSYYIFDFVSLLSCLSVIIQ